MQDQEEQVKGVANVYFEKVELVLVFTILTLVIDLIIL
jgi:hypothetical protein